MRASEIALEKELGLRPEGRGEEGARSAQRWGRARERDRAADERGQEREGGTWGGRSGRKCATFSIGRPPSSGKRNGPTDPYSFQELSNPYRRNLPPDALSVPTPPLIYQNPRTSSTEARVRSRTGEIRRPSKAHVAGAFVKSTGETRCWQRREKS
ncbi:hypothetical protein KM043_008283 [Ampulex compressa]|nr:hypothetical protein KM043_008283 [Ampulex compressa]